MTSAILLKQLKNKVPKGKIVNPMWKRLAKNFKGVVTKNRHVYHVQMPRAITRRHNIVIDEQVWRGDKIIWVGQPIVLMYISPKGKPYKYYKSKPSSKPYKMGEWSDWYSKKEEITAKIGVIQATPDFTTWLKKTKPQIKVQRQNILTENKSKNVWNAYKNWLRNQPQSVKNRTLMLLYRYYNDPKNPRIKNLKWQKLSWTWTGTDFR